MSKVMDGRASHRTRRRMHVGLALWVVAVCFGFGALFAYGSEAGVPGNAPASWPEEAAVPIDPERPALVMVAHPRCPCTRASLAELARLRGQVGDALDCFVLFARPFGTDDVEASGDLWRAALEIPGAAVIVDEDGETAERLGATTSGHVVLYHRGELVFEGGITKSRAHEGDNPGRAVIREYVLRGRTARESTPVYGCALSHIERGERP